MANVLVLKEQARGCGYRKPAKDGVGIYLVGPAFGIRCGRLPLPLGVCPVCSCGIKPSRSWTWIEPRKLFSGAPECQMVSCGVCPAGAAMPEGRHGLLWVGEGFYKTPEDFRREAGRMGISRKLSALPKGFELGTTWVFLAHRHAVDGEHIEAPRTAGVFSVFKPTHVDLVIADEHNVPEKATKLAEQIGDGARIVRVERDEMVQTSLPTHQPATP